MPTRTTARRPFEQLRARVGGGAALLEAIVVFFAYLLLSVASYRFTYSPEVGIAASWPASGLALGVLVRRPRDRWPLLLLAVFAAVIVGLGALGVPPVIVLVWALADVVEPLAGALLIQKAMPTPGLSLLRAREVYLFVVYGGIVGPLAGTAVAVSGAVVAGFHLSLPWWRFAIAWWGSAALGAISLGPLLLAALGMRGSGPTLRRLAEGLLLVVALLGLTAFGFTADGRVVQFTALATAAFPVLAWAAIRFGPAGAAWGATSTSLVAIYLTRRGIGPFAAAGDLLIPARLEIVLIQAFFALATISALTLAAIAAEQRRAFRAQQALADAGGALAAMEPINERLQRALDGAARRFGDVAALWLGEEVNPAALALHPGAESARLVFPVFEGRELGATTQRCDEKQCWLLVPLRLEPRQAVGILGVRATRRRHYFDAGETSAVEGLAHRLALALERERLLAESERLYHEAAEAVHLREQFLSIASHELKTPLTPLAARLELLKRRLKAGLPVELDSIEKAQKSLGRLTWLINDLLDVSRIQSGTLRLRRAPTSMPDVVHQVIAGVRPAEMDRIQFDPPPADLVVDGDPHRLEQVVSNLVDNALKYSPAGRIVRVRLDQTGGAVVLTVIDRGLGIPSEQLPHLFERFFRASNVSATRYGGLGLGLYIVCDIVARHGGRVWAESEEGVGSSFHVALPLLEVQPWKSGAATAEP